VCSEREPCWPAFTVFHSLSWGLSCALADEDISSCFQECFEFIHAALLDRHSVLAYCTAGISRSATVVVGYLMWRHKMPYDKAFAEVKFARKYGLVDHLRCT